MESDPNNVTMAAKAHRRRSAITIIVPGEDGKPVHPEPAARNSPQKEHSTFDSFKAKPRCPTPDPNDTVNGMMPHHMGNVAPPPPHMMYAAAPTHGSGPAVVPPARSGAPPAAALPRGKSTNGAAPSKTGALPQVSPPLTAPQHQLPPTRQAAANRLANMHLFPVTPPSHFAAPRRLSGSGREAEPVTVPTLPSHPPPLSATLISDGTSMWRATVSDDAADGRRAGATGKAPFTSVNAAAPPLDAAAAHRTAGRLPSSGRLKLKSDGDAGPRGGAASTAGAAASTPRASAAGNAASAAPAAVTSHLAGNGGGPASTPYPASQQRRLSAPPLQPTAVWTSSTQRPPPASTHPHTPANAVGLPRGEDSPTTHAPAGRRSTVPQVRPPHQIDLTRLPRPPVRRVPDPLLAVSGHDEKLNSRTTLKSTSPDTTSPPSGDNDDSCKSTGTRSSSGDTDDAKSASAARDSSLVMNDFSLGSALNLTSAWSEAASPRQHTVSPPVDMKPALTRNAAKEEPVEVVVSPPASPLASGRVAQGVSSSNSRDTAAANDVSGVQVLDELLEDASATDFSVVLDSSDLATISGGRQRQLTTSSSSRTVPSGVNGSHGRTSTATTAEANDTSSSSFGLLPQTGSAVSKSAPLAALVHTSSSPLVSAPQLPQGDSRARRARDASVRLPSPVTLDSLIFPKTTEWSISSPLTSGSRHRHNVAARPGRTQNSGGEFSFSGVGGRAKVDERRHAGATVVPFPSDENLCEALPKVNTSTSNWNLDALTSAEKESLASGSAVAASDLRTHPTSRHSASGSSSHPSPSPATDTEPVAPLTTDRWHVTQSLSIDPDLFSFSQLPHEQQGSTVAKLRKMFESNKEKRPRGSRSADMAPSTVAPRSPSGHTNSAPQLNASRANSNNSTTSTSARGAAKGSPQQQSGSGACKTCATVTKRTQGGANSSHVSASQQSLRSLTVVPSVLDYSLCQMSPPPTASVKTSAGCSGQAASDGADAGQGRRGVSSLSLERYDDAASAITESSSSPLMRRTTMSHTRNNASSVKTSPGVVTSVSLQRSDPGFSLACFDDANTSGDTVNLHDRYDI
ncbi:hypothetical protein NESM_000460900 [Novymonas esmeraldas]|uniref:Uncharacterized protein n=1 Tax=Novymonas esmeraldas TaxID=1808958 RepID=A0AAW0EQD2_9TRYP